MERIMEFKVTIIENALELFKENFDVKEEAKNFFKNTCYYVSEIHKEMQYIGIMQEYIDLFDCADPEVIFDKYIEVLTNSLEFDYQESKTESDRAKCYFTVKCRFDVEKYIRIMDQGMPEDDAEKDKEYYIGLYDKAYDRLLEEAKKDGSVDPQDTANNLFDETATAEEVVGNYLEYHGDYAFKEWMENLAFYTERCKEKQQEFPPIKKAQDEKVTEILSKLCKQAYVYDIVWDIPQGSKPNNRLSASKVVPYAPPFNESPVEIQGFLYNEYGFMPTSFKCNIEGKVYEFKETKMLGLGSVEWCVPEGMKAPEVDGPNGTYCVELPSMEKFNTDKNFTERVKIELMQKYGFAPIYFHYIRPDGRLASYRNMKLSILTGFEEKQEDIATSELADIYLDQYGEHDAYDHWMTDRYYHEDTHMFSEEVGGILSRAYYESTENKSPEGTGCYGVGSEACLNGCTGCDKKPKEHVYTVGNVHVKTTETAPLSEEEIRCFWDDQAMFILWNDGTDSMCQENGYELVDIIKAINEGKGQVYFDGYDPKLDPSYELKMSQYMDQREYEREKNSRFIAEPVKEWLVEDLGNISGDMCIMTGTASELIEQFCSYMDGLGTIITDRENFEAKRYKEYGLCEDTDRIEFYLDEPEPRFRARAIDKIKKYNAIDDLKKCFN